MISIKNIKAGYDGVEIIKGVSFALNDCENLSIIGPNGCGKTTLLRAIAGTISCEGEIEINGQVSKKMKKKELAKKIAMLSQNTQVFFNYTVLDMVMMGRYAHNHAGVFDRETKEDTLFVEEALEKVGLLEYREREVDSLSGGQLQRVFLAKLIAQNPDIILLDEPTNHLDLSYQVELIRFLKEWALSNHKIIIGVLHDVNLAMALSEKILLLENGVVTAFGKCEEVFQSDFLNKAYKMDVSKYMIQTLRKWERMEE